jgi:hypothetical protein
VHNSMYMQRSGTHLAILAFIQRMLSITTVSSREGMDRNGKYLSSHLRRASQFCGWVYPVYLSFSENLVGRAFASCKW